MQVKIMRRIISNLIRITTSKLRKHSFSTKPKKNSNKKAVGYFELFRYATFLDKLCIFIGLICSVIKGFVNPALMLAFGNCFGAVLEYVSSVNNDTMSQVEKDKLLIETNRTLWVYIYVSIAAAFSATILTYLSVVLINYSATRQILKLRIMLLEKILHQGVSWFDVNRVGDISPMLTQNLVMIEEGIGDLVVIFLSVASNVVAGAVLSLIKGWKVALAGLICLPVFATVTFGISRLSAKFAEQEIESYGAAGAVAEEVLTSIKTVLAFNGQEIEKLRYEKHLASAKICNIKRGFFNGSIKGIYLFLGYSAFGLAFFLGTKLIIVDKYLPKDEQIYNPASVVTIVSVAILSFWDLEILPKLFDTFTSTKAAAQRVFFILNSEPVLKREVNFRTISDEFCSNIIFDNVYFNYPSRPDVKVLQGFSLKINKGETLALVGSSGCGKTTCIELLQRFYDPILGKILIDNIDIKNHNPNWLKQNIAVVSQEPVLFDTTVYENIRFGKLTASTEEIEEAAEKAHVHEFILRLPNGYQTLLGEGGTQVSGGQKQKIAIARALVKKPQIMLLDEATSALDCGSEAEIQNALDSVKAECTIIVVSHRLSNIKKVNRIAVIKEGKVLEDGSHTELLKRRGVYYDMLNCQKFISVDETVESEREISQIVPTKQKLPTKSSTKDEATNEIEIAMDKMEKKETKKALWKIMKMNLSQWYFVIPGCILAIISGMCIPVYGIIFGNILKVFSNQNDNKLLSGINQCVSSFLILGTVVGISAFFQIFGLSMADAMLAFKIRSKSFDAILKQEMGWFDRKENGIGSLCSQLAGDAMYIQRVSGHQLGVLFQILSLFFFTFLISFYHEWRITLVLMPLSLGLLFLSIMEQKVLIKGAKERTKMIDLSAKISVEAISNLKMIASLGCEKAFLDQYAKELLNYKNTENRKSHIRGIVIGLANFLAIFAYPLGLWYGIKLIIDENIDCGSVIIVTEIMVFSFWHLGNMIATSPNVHKGIVAAEKVITLLERVPTIKNNSNSIKALWTNEYVDYSKIDFSYPTRPSTMILKDLSLKILRGKNIALVGPTGSGKSTIIQLLQRFYDPNSGEILINDTDISKMDLRLIRSQWGVVSQEPTLFAKTIAENIAYGDNNKAVDMDAIIAAAKATNIHNFICGLPEGYMTRIGSRGSQLSGGQKQRIAIARALIKNPQILLLDEATSALDNDTEKIVQEALDNARKGRTCITVAHRLTTIQDADVICVLKDGFITEIGTHQELINKKGLYYKLYKIQTSSFIS